MGGDKPANAGEGSERDRHCGTPPQKALLPGGRQRLLLLLLIAMQARDALGTAPSVPETEPECPGPTFSPAQTQPGQALYEHWCAACHGTDLIANDPAAPNLTGRQFQLAWEGKSLAELLARIRASMPPGGGSKKLSPGNYADIVAYLLQFNRYQAADTGIERGAEPLNGTTIELMKGCAR